jgi:DNA-directed RNA polymerase specialized sigma24 family protein
MNASVIAGMVSVEETVKLVELCNRNQSPFGATTPMLPVSHSPIGTLLSIDSLRSLRRPAFKHWSQIVNVVCYRKGRKELSAMLVEDALIHESLQQIVAVLTRDRVLHPDLMQECLIHLWKLQSEKPGHTRSWYLQNCRFHIQHWLASGRSVDSLKRNSTDKRIPISGNDEEPAWEEYYTSGDLFEGVSFHDVVSTVGRQLKPRQRQVLYGLADGMVLREIASELGLSYPTALKCRRTIARVITKLGISLIPGSGTESLADSRWQSPTSESEKTDT